MELHAVAADAAASTDRLNAAIADDDANAAALGADDAADLAAFRRRQRHGDGRRRKGRCTASNAHKANARR